MTPDEKIDKLQDQLAEMTQATALLTTQVSRLIDMTDKIIAVLQNQESDIKGIWQGCPTTGEWRCVCHLPKNNAIWRNNPESMAMQLYQEGVITKENWPL